MSSCSRVHLFCAATTTSFYVINSARLTLQTVDDYAKEIAIGDKSPPTGPGDCLGLFVTPDFGHSAICAEASDHQRGQPDTEEHQQWRYHGSLREDDANRDQSGRQDHKQAAHHDQYNPVGFSV